MRPRGMITTTIAAVALSGALLGASQTTATAASAAPAAAGASPTMCAGDNVTLQARVQQLADAFAEGLQERGRKKLMKNKRLWQKAFAPCAGTVHLKISMASGEVFGETDFALTQQQAQAFRIALPPAKKLLKHTKNPTLLAAVTMTTPTGEVLSAMQGAVVYDQGIPAGH